VQATETFVLERFVFHIMRGNAPDAQAVLLQGGSPEPCLEQVLWPTIGCVAALESDGLISPAVRQRAEELLRHLADQTIRLLPALRPDGRTVLLQPAPRDELAGHVTSGILKRHGWRVFYAGGDFSLAELVAWAGMLRPQAIVIAGRPRAPEQTREFLAGLHHPKLWPAAQLVLLGGAPDLLPRCWSDLSAGDPLTLARVMHAQARRRRHAAPGLAPAGPPEAVHRSWLLQHGFHAN